MDLVAIDKIFCAKCRDFSRFLPLVIGMGNTSAMEMVLPLTDAVYRFKQAVTFIGHYLEEEIDRGSQRLNFDPK